ncbi:hypothetical protein [Microvirga sp. VF16]|uniref:hypothetical protein n=1 Tax=Microvirga sp. VF16 TaxID=2807101 RepID=UPI00193E719E|nr:hypothetical protein [Microvirga sp. VF16]QRM34972.1 hypothetical protein JO965_42695 [Microvirga sp. VF16]
MIFLIAIFVPPISLVIRDAKYDAIASLVMICLCILLAPAVLPYIWIAAIVHSFQVIRRQDEDRRTQDIIAAIKGRPTASDPVSAPAPEAPVGGQIALQTGA